MATGRYIVFYCDRCDLLREVISSIVRLHPDVDIQTFSDIKEMVTDMNGRRPDLILVYLTLQQESHLRILKKIRDDGKVVNTPVFIFHTLPDEATLSQLF